MLAGMAAGESWWTSVTQQRIGAQSAGAVNISGVEVTGERPDLQYPALRWQTSFEEFQVGRHAPLNSQGLIGVAGWPVQAFGHQLYARYPEFLLFFRLEKDGKSIKPYTLEGFQQRAMAEDLPAIVTEFDDGGMHYELTALTAPTQPQPIDVYTITLSNRGKQAAQARLVASLDGAPTLKAEGDLLVDRGKPLAVLTGQPEAIGAVQRAIGVVDPRCTAAGSDAFLGKHNTWRDGYYGMPIEYMFKAEAGKRYRVHFGTDGTPPWICFGRGYTEAQRKVVLSAEGAPDEQTLDLNYAPGAHPRATLLLARDTDGDGWIRLASRAAPDSRQPAILREIWVFEENAPETAEAELLAQRYLAPPLYHVSVGVNCPSWRHDIMPGDDPTWQALELRYTPRLEPGETRSYVLTLPAIDRLELMPYGNSYHPYDTGQSWMRNLEPRHPENGAPHGEDVPPGTDPAEYAAHGPKPRELWQQQLTLARETTPAAALALAKDYWEQFVARRVRFNTPDPQLNQLYRAQLALLDVYLLKFGEHDVWLQMGGPFNYWDFCYRDNSYEMRAWDMAGYPDIAGKLCDSLLRPASQMPLSRWTVGQWDQGENDGLWLTRPGQWDGQGQTLGALVDHYLLTGDKVWLEKAWPSLERGARWIQRARVKQKASVGNPADWQYGLLPPGELEAAGNGNPYYINAYGIYGLRMVARAAEALGKGTEAAEFRAEADEFSTALMRAARERFVRFNDYAGTLSVDPKDQTILGTWPGSSLVYPLEVFDPFDPLIDGWYRFREIEAAEQGGLMGFPYIYADWVISYIRRGQPDRYVDLFGSYVDSASTMLGWSEGQNLYFPYTADFETARTAVLGAGDMPHAEACSNYIILLRNLFVHEEGETLHLAPATPRRWMAQDQPFGCEAAPTYFGKVTLEIRPDRDRETIHARVSLDPDRKPAKVLLHLRTPEGRGLRSVELNGKPCATFAGDTIILPDPPAQIELTAKIRP